MAIAVEMGLGDKRLIENSDETLLPRDLRVEVVIFLVVVLFGLLRNDSRLSLVSIISAHYSYGKQNELQNLQQEKKSNCIVNLAFLLWCLN